MSVERARGLLAAAGLLLAVGLQGGEVAITASYDRVEPAHRDEGVHYAAAITAGSGWRREAVENAIEQARTIFDQCRVTVDARVVYWLEASPALGEIDEANQDRVLSILGKERPLAVFTGQTTAGDVAYSYLRSAPVASRATAWVTRRGAGKCAGVLLAHELGHILLDTPRHHADDRNLMSHTCTRSNVSGSTPGVGLDDEQCAALRRSTETW